MSLTQVTEGRLENGASAALSLSLLGPTHETLKPRGTAPQPSDHSVLFWLQASSIASHLVHP